MSLVVLGGILLVAAVAKIGLLWSDPFADLTTGYPIWVLYLAVVCELALGIAVFTRIPLPLLWLGYTTFFAILLVVSVTRWSMGYQTCDCFGSIKLPIWVTPVLNVVALVLLWLSLPRKSTLENELKKVLDLAYRDWPSLAGKTFGIVFVLLLVSASFYGYIGDVLQRRPIPDV